MAGGSMKRQKTGGRKLGVKNKPTLARERAAAEKIREPAAFEGDAHLLVVRPQTADRKISPKAGAESRARARYKANRSNSPRP